MEKYARRAAIGLVLLLAVPVVSLALLLLGMRCDETCRTADEHGYPWRSYEDSWQ